MKVIRKNVFDGLMVGNCASGYNGYEDLTGGDVHGLMYLCNQNFDVMEDGVDFDVSTGKIGPYQLLFFDFDEFYAAGNRFSLTATDFSNEGDGDIEYFVYDNGVNEVPSVVLGDITVSDGNEQNTCPSDYCAPPCMTPADISIAKDDFDVALGKYKSSKVAYSSSPSDSLLLVIAYYRSSIYASSSSIVLHHLYDTSTYSQDTLQVWVSNLYSFSGDVWLSGLHLALGDTVSAMQILDSIPARFTLSTEQLDDLDRLVSLTEFLFEKSIFQIDSAVLASIAAYDTCSGQAGHWARSILTSYGNHYLPNYIFSEGVIERSSPPGQYEFSKPLREPIIAYPNPATSKVIFSLGSVGRENNNIKLVVWNSLGEVVYFESKIRNTEITWKLNDQLPGLYFYRLTDGEETLGNGKIILVR